MAREKKRKIMSMTIDLHQLLVYNHEAGVCTVWGPKGEAPQNGTMLRVVRCNEGGIGRDKRVVRSDER
jgi:hypothetical protein